MKRFGKLATVGVVAVLGVGIGATQAPAYSISSSGVGGAYTGTGTAGYSTTFGAAHVFNCSIASYSGTATGADTASITLASGSPCIYLGFPGAGAQSGAWDLKVVAGPDGSGYYHGELAIPTGATTTGVSPVLACTGAFTGPQAFRHGFSGTVIRMKNVAGGATLEMNLNGIAYSATGACFPSGSGGGYSTKGVVTLPGVSVS